MRHLQPNDELINTICEFVKKGSPFESAYILSGVGRHAGEKWRVKAREDLKANKTAQDSVYVKLSIEMDKAKQAFIQSLIDCITVAAKDPKHWRARKYLEVLEARRLKESKTRKLVISQEDANNI